MIVRNESCFATAAMRIEKPRDRSFVKNCVYAWQSLDEPAMSGYWFGEFE